MQATSWLDAPFEQWVIEIPADLSTAGAEGESRSVAAPALRVDGGRAIRAVAPAEAEAPRHELEFAG